MGTAGRGCPCGRARGPGAGAVSRAPSGFSLPRGGCGSNPVLLLDGATRGVAWEQHKPGERPGERRSDGGLVTTECGGAWSAPWRPCGPVGSLPPVSGPWWRPRRGMRSPHSSLCGGGIVQGAPLTAWPKTERQARGLRRGEGGQAAPWAPWRGVLRPARWSGPPASHTRSDPCAVPGSRQDPGQAHERGGTTLDLHRAPSPQERWG